MEASLFQQAHSKHRDRRIFKQTRPAGTEASFGHPFQQLGEELQGSRGCGERKQLLEDEVPRYLPSKHETTQFIAYLFHFRRRKRNNFPVWGLVTLILNSQDTKATSITLVAGMFTKTFPHKRY